MAIRSKQDKAELFLQAWRMLSGGMSEPDAEYRFASPRRWRFDFAWDYEKIAVEIEGNAWHVRGGGKHMQDKDMEKYNMAALMGWRVFRFSPAMLKKDPAGCVEIVLAALEG
jgi:very-short-patch-repair endonuclease